MSLFLFCLSVRKCVIEITFSFQVTPIFLFNEEYISYCSYFVNKIQVLLFFALFNKDMHAYTEKE